LDINRGSLRRFIYVPLSITIVILVVDVLQVEQQGFLPDYCEPNETKGIMHVVFLVVLQKPELAMFKAIITNHPLLQLQAGVIRIKGNSYLNFVRVIVLHDKPVVEQEP